MKLSEILSGIEFDSKNFKDLNVRGIVSNSKQVQRDFLFIALRGENRDGHDFIYKAIERRANVIVSEKGRFDAVFFKDNVVLIEVEDTKEIIYKIASNFYANPAAFLDTVGITGTNGKTTISFILENIFNVASISSGLIGTICYKVGNREIPALNTTPDPISIQKYIREMVDLNGDVVLLEASSQGLYQGRLNGLKFDYAIFTNLGRDHLDYHSDMEGYFQAKRILFDKLLKERGIAIINVDDSYGKRLWDGLKKEKISYGINNEADVKLLEYDIDINGMHLKINALGEVVEFYTTIIGKHNIYNILAAVALALRFGIKREKIYAALSNFKGVKGRLEQVFGSSKIKVFVDYAHTPEALNVVLSTMKSLTSGKLWVVFGAGGNRYRDKRFWMGRVASQLADKVVVTSDNPRDENPNRIISDIMKGVENQEKCFIVPDRKEAIQKTIAEAEEGDVVLIAGKGHEKYQIIGNLTIPFDDREIASRVLLKRTMEKMADVV